MYSGGLKLKKKASKRSEINTIASLIVAIPFGRMLSRKNKGIFSPSTPINSHKVTSASIYSEKRDAYFFVPKWRLFARLCQFVYSSRCVVWKYAEIVIFQIWKNQSVITFNLSGIHLLKFKFKKSIKKE